MNVLVTGGSGSVGKYIVDELVDHGHTVGILDIVPPSRQSNRFHQVDILNLGDVIDAVQEYDVIVHTAGIPHPLNDPAEKVFTVNVNGTFNVLEAAARTSIKKVVFTSSESTLGFAFSKAGIIPDFAPVDETHATLPQDPYGLSKVVCEQLCRSYSDAYGIRTVCLREPWIWVPEQEHLNLYRGLISNYEQWYKNLWAYVHVFDAAQAHRLAVENDLEHLHDCFFITADQNWTGIDSGELLERFYPTVRTGHPDLSGAYSLISNGKAKQLLGYQPQYSAGDLLTRP